MVEQLSQEKSLESQHLTEVLAKIEKATTKVEKTIMKTKGDEKVIFDNFYNDVRLDFSSYEDLMDTAMSIRQQQQMLSERRNSHQQSTQELNVLKKLAKNPYFARIDFHESGEESAETIYIGLGSFTDRTDHYLIYDWRAPISSVYYDGGLGEIAYQTPDGPQQVDVTLKRQFLIEDAKITAMFDTQETIGDQMLLEVLGEQSDTKMKSIVTTIQREQNQIIRDTDANLLFVQGAAGSGKTSAVLQRVAYLLYRYRGNLTSSQVLLFSPNQLFNDYVSNVLPELGEQNMVQLTYFQYAAHRLPNIKVQSLAQLFEQQEQPHKSEINALKGSLAFFEATKQYATSLEQSGMLFRDLTFRDEVIVSKEKIEEIYYSYNSNYHLGNRLNATKEKLMTIINSRIEAETKEDWVEEAIETMDTATLRKLRGGETKSFKSAKAEFHFLAKRLVSEAFADLFKGVRRNRFLNIKRQIIAFLKATPNLLDLTAFGVDLPMWNQQINTFITDLKDNKLSMEDVTPYLFLYDLISGKRGDREIRFVFVDEIQDYTPYQLGFMRFSFPKAKFTLLGDLNQAIFTKENSQSLLSQVQELFDPDATRIIRLTQSYRSTQEITDFTKNLLVDGEKITSFARDGELPSLYERDSEASLIKELVKILAKNTAEKQTTAIITKTEVQAKALYETLKEKGEALTLIRGENQRLAPGVIVVPSYLAKGLEFDAVVVWDATEKNYPAESEQQLLYTVASRAMHQLTIMADAALSPLILRVPAKYYVNK